MRNGKMGIEQSFYSIHNKCCSYFFGKWFDGEEAV
ncbi:hypothetical protein N784_15540 [Pontibacillus litoralis JSM 072002]|uniref:Uncharacterized protein n=1 Tax=Pontibacillus litoralis JSM 072002 TaxID=1385512 RepID=A0A0A5HUT2_9BACI|nr:hypothetical protein N784_15540 [Pontibacillus litoralis JSM 072002]